MSILSQGHYPYQTDVKWTEVREGRIYEIVRTVTHSSPRQKTKCSTSRFLGYAESEQREVAS